MIGMLNNYQLPNDLRGSDCTTNWFRRQNRNKRQALCNWTNADMQSANDEMISKFVLDGNTHALKQTTKLAKKAHKTSTLS